MGILRNWCATQAISPYGFGSRFISTDCLRVSILLLPSELRRMTKPFQLYSCYANLVLLSSQAPRADRTMRCYVQVVQPFSLIASTAAQEDKKKGKLPKSQEALVCTATLARTPVPKGCVAESWNGGDQPTHTQSSRTAAPPPSWRCRRAGRIPDASRLSVGYEWL